MKKKKKRSITLIEIMIVILLIGIIGGTLAFNMRGSMDQGRAFKSEQNMLRIHDILMLEMASSGRDLPDIVANWEENVKNSPMVKGGSEICKDGWNKPFEVKVINDDLQITSSKLKAFKKKHEKKS